LVRSLPNTQTRLLLLGTGGGPWIISERKGPASALIVNGAVYQIDCGEGVARQMWASGSGSATQNTFLEALRAIFLTHLHSDHTVDYFTFFLFGWSNGLAKVKQPVQIFGPGRRGAMEPIFGSPDLSVATISPENPTPGTVDMTNALFQAYATDINDRMRDYLWPDLRSLVRVHDISIPEGIVTDPNVNPAPSMAPFVVMQDENVMVSATLVSHAPIFPAFAFRFDMADGAVVFSGDTCASPNLIQLAQGADILVHEVIDADWVSARYPLPRTPSQESLLHHLLSAHTSIEEVGKVAETAGVKTLILNHLVPPDIPKQRWLEAGKNFSGELIVAEDLMQIVIGNPQSFNER